MNNEMTNGNENIELYRSEYLPQKIQLLLVGEAPPDAQDRFFYYPYVKTADYLFLAIIKVFGGESMYNEYIKARKRNEINKKLYLEKLKAKGVYLMDLSSYPAGKVVPESQKDTFIKSLETLAKNGNIAKNTPVILIKKNVYDCLYHTLRKEDYNVLNYSAIPFPSCGQQKKFNEIFLKTLQKNKINIAI